MNFTITQNNPYATELVGPGATYVVQSGTLRRHSTVSRGGALVAQMDWHSFSPDMLRLSGAGAEPVRIRKFLRPEPGGSRRSKRTFVVGGQSYTWYPARSHMTLRSGDISLATMQRHPLKLHVSQSAPSMLPVDIIVVTMLIMWTFRHRRVDENSGAGDDVGGEGGNADGPNDIGGGGGGIISDDGDDGGDDGGGDWSGDSGGRGGDGGGGDGGGGAGGDGGGGGGGDGGGGGGGGAGGD